MSQTFLFWASVTAAIATIYLIFDPTRPDIEKYEGKPIGEAREIAKETPISFINSGLSLIALIVAILEIIVLAYAQLRGFGIPVLNIAALLISIGNPVYVFVKFARSFRDPNQILYPKISGRKRLARNLFLYLPDVYLWYLVWIGTKA